MPRLKSFSGIAILLFVVVMLIVGGCGGSSGEGSASAEASERSKPFRIPVSTAPIRRAEEIRFQPSGLVGSEPKPVLPQGPPPKTLALQDLVQGIGHLVQPGDEVTIQYVATDYESGKKLESSWDQGKPLSFTVGDGKLLEGLEEGVREMEVGDRREMVIPPNLNNGSPLMAKVPADTTVVLLVDLIEAGSPAAGSS